MNKQLGMITIYIQVSKTDPERIFYNNINSHFKSHLRKT